LKILVDTHVFLWFIAGDQRLSRTARAAVESITDDKLFSVASLWEIAIKLSLGRLELPSPHGSFLRGMLGDVGIGLLPILPEHVELVASLPVAEGRAIRRAGCERCWKRAQEFASGEQVHVGEEPCHGSPVFLTSHPNE
jgi:PIN domain nuclease of toxin-antitoxin system